MRFSLVSAIATLGSVVMAQPVAQPVAQLAARTVTSQDTVDVLNVLKAKAHDLEELEKKMNLVNVFVQFPHILTGYQDIIVTTRNFVAKDQSSAPAKEFSVEECTTISGAYHTFASANQAALSVLIGKSALPTSQPFRPPMWTTLRSLEKAYDQLAFDVNAYCPKATSIKSDQASLDRTIAQAIQTYEQPY